MTSNSALTSAPADIRYWLGIDAGGTKSLASLVDEHGHELGRVTAGAGNLRIGVEAVEQLTLGIARQALDQAGLPQDAVSTIGLGLGLAGLSRASQSRQLIANQWPFARVTIASDAEIAHLGAHGGKDGAILIVGTGSIAYLKVDGKVDTMGGYGFPISDEASGAALGLSAVRHALRALDGRSRSTPLSDAVTSQFDDSTVAVIEWMETATPGDFASFAPLVISYAEKGDYIARSIVIEAVRHIERFIETIFEKGAPRCSLMGGLAAHLRPWLRARTSEMLVEPAADAVSGALMLAGLPKVAVLGTSSQPRKGA
ncbi:MULTISPECIES: BadF/BadG/BcrA/BcrD ATPase family protein [unclassified Erythrobacter]|uniref:BadF/BadG/BcrA/BcrD ATPase family protein n=1 Tax=unclassified Erythrobacter TaxID=2633097 RepID=UPI0007CFF904|nr:MULTISPECIES: BadF/BadG/BcrA/BcrD ATPase family protein [unclassified Erythrobacter]KZY90738.1 ATPase [Erythrobacter sp. HI0074]KZZ04412.1 ATPase [Erythrobacter sp. HI0077]